MNTEYEVRILEVNVDEITKKLDDLGAVFVGSFDQKRYIYDVKPKTHNKWIRLRTSGKKTTLAIKDLTSDKIDGVKEMEIVVSDFEETNILLQELGFCSKGYQENRRLQYVLGNAEVDIDYWPMIPPFIEIEGKDEQEVYQTLEKLGYNKTDIESCDTEKLYEKYGYDLPSIEVLKFGEEK